MKRMIRILRPTLGAAVILCAFAGALPAETPTAPKSQESGRTEWQGPPSK
jgi:hypothetical protein